MLITESQNRFAQSTMQPMLEGRSVVLPEMLQAPWQAVLDSHPSTINIMNAEERTELLSKEVDKEMKMKATEIIDTKAENPEEKTKLKQRLNEGQSLLVRKLDSEVFDTLITPDNIGEYKALEYEIFSPSLQSSTNDLKQVMDWQSMIHVVGNLQQWVNIEGSELTEEGIQVHVIDRKTMKRGVIKVKIDPTQARALLYDMGKDAKGPRFISEEEMPEWGSIVDHLIQPELYTKALMGMMTGKTNREKEMAAQGLMAATTALWGVGQGSHANQEENAAIQGQIANQATGAIVRPEDFKVARPNVMASKEDLRAKAATRNKRIEGERTRMAERREQSHKEQDMMTRKKIEDNQLAAQEAQAAGMNNSKTYGAIGAGLASVAGIGITGFSSFLLLFG